MTEVHKKLYEKLGIEDDPESWNHSGNKFIQECYDRAESELLDRIEAIENRAETQQPDDSHFTDNPHTD
jgi:chaperonin cofactor prefoldin